MFGYGLSYGPISWLFIIKLLPGLSFSIIIAVENIFSTLIAYSYPALFDNISKNYIILIFSLMSVGGLIFAILFIVEIKGKSQK